MIAEQPHPMVQAIAADLAAHLPRGEASLHTLRAVASLAAVLDLTGAEIQAAGCTEALAYTFGQIAGRPRYERRCPFRRRHVAGGIAPPPFR